MRRFHLPIRAAAFVLALAVPATSAVPLWADVLGSDADALNGGSQSAITLSATPGQTLTFPVSLFVECQTKDHMSGATTIAYAAGASTVPAGGTLSATSVSIPKPAGWPLDSQNCGAATSTPVQTSTVTLGAPVAGGTYAYSLHWSSSDGDVDSSPHGKVDITLTVAAPTPVDTTPPVITRTVDGTVGLAGWYTSSVTVSWSVSDPESPVVIDSGCGVQSFTADTAAGSSTCTAHSAGGTATDTADFKIDQTGPVSLSAALSRPADHNGWFNHALDVVFAGSDATSGIASCDTLTYAGPDGSGLSLAGGCTDNAGNAATTTSSAFDYDATAPTLVAGAPDRAPDHNGWFNHPVDVVFTGADGGSGIDTCDTVGYSGPDGSARTVNGGCTDLAGNTSNVASAPFNYDATAPLVSGAPDRAPDHNGWFNHALDVAFSGTDATSGIESCDTIPYGGPDGTGITVNGGCTDGAGNTATTGSSPFDYDGTAPSITITSPANGGSYVKGSSVAAAYDCSDALSGVDTCDGTVADGSAIDTASVGGKVFAVSATDQAGNTASKSHLYNVVFDWLGFLRPIDNLPVVNVVKAGSAVPVKFSLGGNQGLGIFIPGSPSSQKVACDTGSPQDAIETTVTAGGSTLSYDAATDQYTYVWKTDKAWASSCRMLTVTLLDGTTHQAAFKLAK
ncbi:MAG: PxKF domain-containing protein [Actinomycetota bacterium]